MKWASEGVDIVDLVDRVDIVGFTIDWFAGVFFGFFLYFTCLFYEYRFCDKYICNFSRTKDQMVQVARYDRFCHTDEYWPSLTHTVNSGKNQTRIITYNCAYTVKMIVSENIVERKAYLSYVREGQGISNGCNLNFQCIIRPALVWWNYQKERAKAVLTQHLFLLCQLYQTGDGLVTQSIS